MKNYTLGLDIGIASIGWTILDTDESSEYYNKLVDFGVRKFNEAEQASTRREARSARVNNRRKVWRKNQLKDAFADFGMISKDLLDDEQYLSFTSSEYEISDLPTIYHIREKGLSEKLTTRELFLSMYSICKNRGYFHLEGIDFENEGVTEEIWINKFIEIVEEKVTIINKDKLVKDYLKPYYNNLPNQKKSISDKDTICETNEDQKVLSSFYKLIKGYKADLTSFGYEKTKNIDELKTDEDLDSYLENFLTLYDLKMIASFMSEGVNYLCEKNVLLHNKHTEMLNRLEVFKIQEDIVSDKFKVVVEKFIKKNKVNCESKEFEDEYLKETYFYFKELDLKNNANGQHKRSIKNLQNRYPNGLYIKEARDILNKQKEFDSKISEDFINVCIEILSARIPYWVGRLESNKERSTNAWVNKKDGKFKYSYNYSKNLINEAETQRVWKENMISRCTYLPDEFALPRKSFIIELFAVLNELNVLSAYKNNSEYYLKESDKIKIIEHLFLKQSIVSFDDVKNLLDLDSFGISVSSKSSRKKFNKSLTVYHNIVKIEEGLRIEDIVKELDYYSKNKECKIEKIEDVILTLNLFEDKENKTSELTKIINDEEKVKKLSKIEIKDYSTLSKKFVCNTPIDSKGLSLIDKLFEDNTKDYTNEQMTLITNAEDKNGDRINFTSNKYIKLLEQNGGRLDYSLIYKDGVANFPVSRGVLRSLNECMKLINDITKYYGTPSKFVIETARDLKDPTIGETAKHYDQMKKLYEDIKKQVKDLNPEFTPEYSMLESKIIKNKKKVELYLRQLGVDIITGYSIDINRLEDDYEIDHILPRGFGDNSMDNSILIHRNTNSTKGNRVPLQMLVETGKEITQYENRVRKLYELKLISENKLNRLLLKSEEEAIGFVQRNLVDTRYIIKEFTSILNAYYSVTEKNVKIVSLQAKFNGLFRNVLEMNKSRDTGLQHHAHDAAIIIVVDKCLEYLYPNYSSGNPYSAKIYKKRVEDLFIEKSKHKYRETINLFRSIYKKSFGSDFREENSFIEEVKNRVPLISYKNNNNYKGKLFEATILDKHKIKDESPLSVLGINDSLKGFSGVECFCVDFYKYTNKKGKKVHAAVHVPKAIISSDGVINKDMYIRLIRDYYSYSELLDNEGNVNEHYFRLRMRKNDVIYDTQRNTPMLFNIGSIANKRLEFKTINITSYKVVSDICNKIYKYLGLYDGDVLDYKKANNFKLVDNAKEVLLFLNEKLRDGHKAKVEEDIILEEIQQIDFTSEKSIILKSVKNLEGAGLYKIYTELYFKNMGSNIRTIAEELAVYILSSQNIFSPPPIIGQILTTANNIKDVDAQYVKVITSVLGVRYENINNKLIINKPNVIGKVTNYKVVKKEKFSFEL